MSCVIEALRHKPGLSLAADVAQLFELPLVEHEVVLPQNSPHEDVDVGILGKQAAEFGAADSLMRAAAIMIVPPCLTMGSTPVSPLIAW